MAAEKKGQTIVIKKINIVAGGHGGSWKVALADFMTALMCFFLVMWLLNQSAETKVAVSDYFSTPSIIEYNFQNFGVELTLEKLFLDLVNEPLKAFQSFMEPADKTPNVMDFSSQKVVAAFMADKMGDLTKNFETSVDGIEFDIADHVLFKNGTAEPHDQYVTVMDRLKSVTSGLEDAIIHVDSYLFYQSVRQSDPKLAEQVSNQRLDLIKKRIDASFEHPTNDLITTSKVTHKKNFIEGEAQRPPGWFHFSIKQKPVKSDGKKPRPLEKISDSPQVNMSVYDSFLKKKLEKK